MSVLKKKRYMSSIRQNGLERLTPFGGFRYDKEVDLISIQCEHHHPSIVCKRLSISRLRGELVELEPIQADTG